MKISAIILAAVAGLALVSSVSADRDSLFSLKKHMHKKSHKKTQHKLSQDEDKPKLKKVKIIGEDVPVAGEKEVKEDVPKAAVAVIGDDATIAAHAATAIPGCDCDVRANGALDVPAEYIQPEMKPCVCAEPTEDQLYEARKNAKAGFAPAAHDGIIPEYRDSLEYVPDLQYGLEAETPAVSADEVLEATPAPAEFDHVVPEFKPEPTQTPEEIMAAAAAAETPIDPMVVFEAAKSALPIVPQMKGEPAPAVVEAPVETVDEVPAPELSEAVQDQVEAQMTGEDVEGDVADAEEATQ